MLAGYLVARAHLISSEGVAGFTNVTFHLFVPALLFRAMRGIHFETLDLKPLYTYFGGALICFFLVLAVSRRWLGRSTRHATVTALGVTFSNTVLLGIPLIKLAFSDAGLVILLMIVSMHSLILVVVATLILEFVGVQKDGSDGAARSHWMNTYQALRNTVFNPVILPIVGGLMWGALRLPLPDVIDAPLAMLAAASGPCSLVLLGASLAQYGITETWRPALAVSALKNIVFPALIWALGRFVFGLDPFALAVVTVTAALPIGANVYLFAQRYNVAQGEITASVAMSTSASVVTLTAVMLWFG